MNEHSNVKSLMAHNLSCYLARHSIKAMVAVLGFAVFIGGPVYAADPVNTKTAAKSRVVPISTEIAPRMEFSPGQSHLIRMPAGVHLQKVKVEDDKIVQVEVTSPREIVLHAKSAGATSIMIWDKKGQVTVMDVGVIGNTVAMDATALQGKLQQMLPNEKGIVVGTAGKSLVLSGLVTDAVKVDKAMTLAEAYAGKDNKVINMLQVGAPQQVMLEVKMAEISKNLLDQLGVAFNFSRANGNVAYSLLKGFGIADLGGKITFTNGQTNVTIDAEKKDTLIKVLAEPNIIAISGQEGSFLAGGKFYIPVPQAGIAAGAVTLEEKDFGVGLRFTPTVLEDGLINLRVAPEVTELLSTTIPVGVGNSPTLSTRRVSTTVQLRDGQSFAIAGLLKSSINEDVRRFPILGEIPILGALFRSSAFKNDKTELLFVVTPRLVKPLPPDYALPTDSFTPPSRVDFFLKGKLEGKPATPAPAPQALPAAEAPTPAPAEQGANDGFEMK
jgi:pilus assembly protein CpaC